MKIVHISDLHYPITGNSEKLIAAIIDQYADVKAKPLVICTGDIIESSSKKRHYLEAKQLLEKLVNDGFKLLLCPGNHDLKFEGLGPMINGAKRFNNYFSTLLPKGHNFYGEEDNELLDFPIVHQFDQYYTIGLNTLEKEKGIGATGELGEEQIQELQSILTEISCDNPVAKIIVYLHHHPLEFDFRPELMKLKDKEEFLESIKGIEILLFGHLHQNKRFESAEKKYDINLIHLGGNCVFGDAVTWSEIDCEDYGVKSYSLSTP